MAAPSISQTPAGESIEMSEHDTKGTDRRSLLRCMGWAGAGALYTVSGGVLTSVGLSDALAAPYRRAKTQPFTFLQISDTHIGFDKAANPNAKATLKRAIAMIKALPQQPDFIIHTGDITHLSKEGEFADAADLMGETGAQVFYTPGEHDILDEGQGKAYLARYGAGTKGSGWYSFDHKGVHFVGLMNVANFKPGGGGGALGDEQIAWLKADLAGRPASTPIVVFAHIPLWSVYPHWGWATQDAEPALAALRRFGSVTILNGHIHQVAQKVEGSLTFHSARSTAYPQPAPGTAPSPGPLKLPADQLPAALGIRTARYAPGAGPIALIDATLA
jgi:3',5'-cyclic-AMP phosphodiesterase